MRNFSSEVMWAITRRHHAFKSSWQGNEWSSAPNAYNGFHNASNTASTIGVEANKEKSKKQFRRVFTLHLAHKPRHLIKKRKNGSQAGVVSTNLKIRKEVNHAAKTIQGLTFANDRTKSKALRRLARLSHSLPANLKGTAAKK